MLRFFHHHWRRRWEKLYRRNRWHLSVDIALIMAILVLVAAVVSLHFYQPNLNWPAWTGIRHQLVDVSNPPVQLQAETADRFFKFKEPVVLQINFNNAGKTAADDVNLTFKSLVPDFIITQVRLGSGASSVDPANIKITDSAVIIKEIGGDSRGTLSLEVYFQGEPESAQRTLSWEVLSEYTLGSQIIKQPLALPALKLASELKVKSSAYYNSPQGDQLGLGPIPPLVGLPTSYWIFWEARSFGDFQDFVCSAKLPAGVELTPNQAILAGDLKYNPDSRQLIWTLKNIAHQADSYRAGFEIQLTPAASQAGQVLPLLADLKYYAQDTASGAEVAGELAAPDTNLKDDRINQGQGQVLN